MKPTVLLLAVLGCVAATPSGYYHQEYNYKTSSSAYKNNELQHQTDDQGYYRKDGDLEGRVRPRVDANSEHSEYVNPNSRTGEYNTGLVGGANGDMSSYGHLRADVGSYGNRDVSSEGLAQADHIAGSRGTYGGYSAGAYGSNSYGSSSQSYGMSSNLRSVTSHLQQELERDLQRAIQENRAYSQSSVGVAELERELRQNVTNRLNAELVNRYGQQSVRGGLSYTISGGRLHSTANYDNQELQDLRSQLENTLLNQLRTQSYQSSSRYESQQASHGSYGYSTSTVRPAYYTHYPAVVRPATTIRPSYPVDYTPDNYIRYTPIPNPESITTIASRVQNRLDSRLNELLEDTQRRYFSSSSSYSLTNADVVLENLRNELRNNITYLLNEDIKANYGNQIPRDGQMYSVGPNGQTSSQYNYAIRDLENLRSQIERNLIEKLNRDFESHRSRWHQQSAYSQSSHSSGNVQYGGYSTPRYDVYSTPRYEVYSTPQYKTYNPDVESFSTRPSSSHITPLITSGGSSNSNRHYNLLAGSSQSGYEISGAAGSSMSQLQRQLQHDLSRQLQAAISRNQYGSYSSSSGTYNPQSYQVSLQQLQDELNRNLTRQLQEYSASGHYSTYGNVDQAQLASLRSQLQTDLMRQLQQGLQQSYQSSSSYSASSSSSSSSNGNYRPARGFDNYQLGQYRSGGGVLTMDGADCVGDDPNAYNTHRMKRSYKPYRSQTLGLSYHGNQADTGYHSNYGYNDNYRNSPSNQAQQIGQVEENPDLGQQVDESDLTQQVQDASFEKLEQGQQTDDSELTQQIQNSRSGKLQSQTQAELGQQTDDSDITQQVEDVSLGGKLQLGSLGQQQVDQGQQVANSDLTQQVEYPSYGKLQLDSQNQHANIDQDTDDLILTQQVEYPENNRLQLQTHNQHQIDQGQQPDDSDLRRQISYPNSGKLQLGVQNPQVDQGQQVDNSDLTQQVEYPSYGKLQLGTQNQQVNLGQDTDDLVLTQQVEYPENSRLQLQTQNQHQVDQGQQPDDFDLTEQTAYPNSGKLQLGVQSPQIDQGQQVDNSDLTQQAEYPSFGKLELETQGQLVGQGQQADNSHLTQQIETLGLGKLQLGSHGHQADVNQHTDNSQLTQQVDHPGFGKLQQETQQTPTEQVDNSDLTQQVQDVDFPNLQKPQSGRQVVDTDLTQQIENNGIGKLELSSQNQQQNSGLTQQVEDSFLSGSQRGDQQSEDIGRITSQQRPSNSGRLQFGQNSPSDEQIYLGSNLNQKQTQAVEQLETELSKQLKDAVNTYYSFSYSGSRDIQSTYQNLIRDLERNLTKQIQTANSGIGGYSYSYTLSSEQLNSLQKQLENKLKSQLQLEISNAEQNINVGQHLTNQHISNTGNIEFSGQQQTRDQQFEGLTQLTENGQISQQPINNDQNIPTQHVATSPEFPQTIGQLPSSQYYYNKPHYSSNIYGNKPSLKPKDSNNFLQTEIAQQQYLYPHQDPTSQQNNFNSRPDVVPLSQSIQKQPSLEPSTTNIEVNPIYPSKPEAVTLVNDLSQQVEDAFTDDQQSQQTDLSQQNLISSDNTPNQPSSSSVIVPTNNENVHSINQSPEVTNQFYETQDESLANAERDADLLISALRGAQQNQNGQSTSGNDFANGHTPTSYSQVLQGSQGSHGSRYHGQYFQSSQTDSFNQDQNTFQLYLNGRQVQLAHQLENDLSKQLKAAVSQNYYTGYTSSHASNQELYRINYEQLLNELQRNITTQIEKTFNEAHQTSYSSYSNNFYNSLTSEQRSKLISELQADLSKQLQQELQISYGIQEQRNGQNSLNSRVIYDSSPRGVSAYGSVPSQSLNSNQYGSGQTEGQILYGQQEIVPESQTVSEYQPIQPEQPTVVQNVEPHVSNYNSGVKGRGRSRSSIISPPVTSQVRDVASPVSPARDIELQQPQSEVPRLELNAPINSSPGTGTQEITEVDEIPQNPTQENLPWWKRFGNKVRQGASSLKEKIVG